VDESLDPFERLREDLVESVDHRVRASQRRWSDAHVERRLHTGQPLVARAAQLLEV
jgi:hypothetical protein